MKIKNIAVQEKNELFFFDFAVKYILAFSAVLLTLLKFV
ncbi:hypothetical protein SAMN05720762_104119 [Fibrobacter sp. UWH4]|nr:hypothetical protein SAMN05720762_104119 [Fibrobacter sp. UWH4]